MRKELLHLRHIYKQRGFESVLRGVDLRIYADEVLFLLGRDSSGKTTLVELLAGIIQPDRGGIFRDSHQLRLKGLHEANAQGIHYICERSALFDNLSVGENICLKNPVKLSLGNYIDRTESIAGILCSEFGVKLDMTVLVRDAGLGPYERVFLEAVRAAYQRADLVIFDNILWQLSPTEIIKITKLVQKMKERHITVVFCAASQREALSMADRVVFLQHGAIAADYTRDTYNPQGALAVMGTDFYPNAAAVSTRREDDSVLPFSFHDSEGELHQLMIERGESVGIFVPEIKQYRRLLKMFGNKDWLEKENKELSNILSGAPAIGVLTLDSLYVSTFPMLSVAENITLFGIRGLDPAFRFTIRRDQSFIRNEICNLLSISPDRWDQPAYRCTRSEHSELALYRLIAQRYAVVVLAGLIDEQNETLLSILGCYLHDLSVRKRCAVLIGRDKTKLSMLCDKVTQIG